jgi:DNA-binding HxlR family transcriptional regulator
MTLKTYNQNCGLASALDVVGERWTLLIIRSLMTGPARFNEIQSRLPGMGTNLLAERLKSLTRWNLIKKESGRQSSYMLTRKGKALRPILHLLARWGRDYVSGAGTQTDPQWAMFNIEASFCPERSEGISSFESRPAEQ